MLPRLCLHFDVNETIMVGDPAGGDTFEQSLCKCIAKSSFVRKRADGIPTEWHDGSPIDPAKRDAPAPPLLCPWDPPEGCISFARTKLNKRHIKTFVDHGSPGVIYRPLFDQMREVLICPEGTPKDARLLHEDGEHMLLLPAFCQILQALGPSGSLAGDIAITPPNHENKILTTGLSGRDFSIVLRSFGCDLTRISTAIAAYVEGKHLLRPLL